MRLISLYLLSFICFIGCTERQIRVHFENAAQYQAKGQIDSAMAEYRTILSINPNTSDAANALGILLAQQNKHRQAIDYYQQALLHEPNKIEILFNLGTAFVATGLTDSAVTVYQKIIALDQKNSEAHNSLGAAYAVGGQFDQALKNYQNALSLDAQNAGAYNNIGLLYTYQGHFQSAVPYYQKAIQHRPNYADAYNNLGSAYAEMDQFELAITSFAQALVHKPNYPLARDNLSQAKTLLTEKQQRQAAGEMRVRHIVVPTESEAQNLIAQLQNGAPFETLAKQYSRDPSSRFGGDIGGFLPGTLMAEFEKAVLKTPVGEIGGPFKTAAGYHIIQRIY
jgi:tetratricopeptide (TPR) repeat protein